MVSLLIRDRARVLILVYKAPKSLSFSVHLEGRQGKGIGRALDQELGNFILVPALTYISYKIAVVTCSQKALFPHRENSLALLCGDLQL